jgi:hypothetical protein
MEPLGTDIENGCTEVVHHLAIMAVQVVAVEHVRPDPGIEEGIFPAVVTVVDRADPLLDFGVRAVSVTSQYSIQPVKEDELVPCVINGFCWSDCSVVPCRTGQKAEDVGSEFRLSIWFNPSGLGNFLAEHWGALQ